MKKPIALLLPFSLLAGCGTQGPGYVQCDSSQWDDAPSKTSPFAPTAGPRRNVPFRVVYHATFPGGALDCGYLDLIHATAQPLKEGDGQVADQSHNLSASPSGKLKLSLTAPDSIPEKETPSVGVFSTDLNFGPGSVFTVRVTFQRPDGPRIPKTPDWTNAWAVGVAARTGDKEDLGSHKRLGVTLRFRDQDGILSVQESQLADNLPPHNLGQFVIPQEYTDKLFSTSPLLSFTLELHVNRQEGSGAATLTVPGVYSKQLLFDTRTFLKESGPSITTVGATLANCCAPGWNVNTEVHDFQISVLRRDVKSEPNVPVRPWWDPL
jgi:hypothetical protein